MTRVEFFRIAASVGSSVGRVLCVRGSHAPLRFLLRVHRSLFHSLNVSRRVKRALDGPAAFLRALRAPLALALITCTYARVSCWGVVCAAAYACAAARSWAGIMMPGRFPAVGFLPVLCVSPRRTGRSYVWRYSGRGVPLSAVGVAWRYVSAPCTYACGLLERLALSA